jgi:hypothetical protein
MRAIFSVLIIVTLAGCNAEQYQSLNIAVYPSVKRCMIAEKLMQCEQLPAYLRDTLKIAANRDITISYAGTETVEKGDTSIEQIGELIKAAGYQKVRAVRYEMK